MRPEATELLVIAGAARPGATVTVSVFGVLMPLVAADLTRRRRYTLCLALLSLAATLGAALSTTIAGPIADRFGRPAAFATLAAIGLAATLLIAFAMPETQRRRS